jgi:hypothetical protein
LDITGHATCSSACTNPQVDFPAQPAAIGKFASIDTTLTRSATSQSRSASSALVIAAKVWTRLERARLRRGSGTRTHTLTSRFQMSRAAHRSLRTSIELLHHSEGRVSPGGACGIERV